MELDHDTCYRALASRDVRFDGRFYIAVKTTRIYCRPICPARTAKSENVQFYRTAAAAQEAGYRPCLRCRPESAPDSGAWRGVSNTGVSHVVARALAQIEAGALDEIGVTALADRLGVGERQLRRLFSEYVGASPLAVAQTRRVLLAKQLIHNTAMPMTDIAFAAGFGSIRRFNEVFLELFHRPPQTLRHRQSAEPHRLGEVTLLLPYRPPYDWAAMLQALAARAIPGIETVADGAYARNIKMGGEAGFIYVTHTEAHALRVRLSLPRLTALQAVIARVRQVLDLAADPDIIDRHLAEDPLLAERVAKQPGLRLPGAWDGLERSVRWLFQPWQAGQVTVLGWQRGIRSLGDALPMARIYGNHLTHTFPTAQRLVDAALSLDGIPLLHRQALRRIAQHYLDPATQHVGMAPESHFTPLLAALESIDTALAQHFAELAAQETDVFTLRDAALLPKRGALANLTDAYQHAEHWRPWRAYAAQHLRQPEPPQH